jgi:pimeloyl-ACP methyl ester carboxylesterase
VPFRIRVFLSILLAFLGLLLIGPLLLPVPPLEGAESITRLAEGGGQLRTLDGVTLYYRSEGSGQPAFLLLHGYPSNSATWRHLLPELALHGHAVAFDRPGFGYSERPLPGSWSRNPYLPEAQLDQALSLLGQLGIDEAVWIGSSSGAMVALRAALEHPERVSGLVLIGAPVYSDRAPPAWIRPLLHSPQMDRAGPLLMRQLGGEPGLRLFASQWADPEGIGAEDIAAFRRTFRADHWDRGLWEVSKASRPSQLGDRLASIQQPVLVVAGVQDQIVPDEESERLARALPRATLALMDGCGHLPQEECPSALLDVLSGWLREDLTARE